MSKREGLWRFDDRSDNWTHVSLNQVFEGMNVSALAFNPYRTGQLLFGTWGQGFYYRQWGDLDGDGDVDQDDFTQFGPCFTGPGGQLPPGCGNADFDGDEHVDCSDWFGFHAAWMGSQDPPDFSTCPEATDLTVNSAELSWTVIDGAAGYDVVRGDLGALRSGHGDFTAAVDSCLAEDHASTALPYGEDPSAGEGRWFLVRGASAYAGMTYGTDERDAEIDASAPACR
jgi:hypothetical protein